MQLLRAGFGGQVHARFASLGCPIIKFEGAGLGQACDWRRLIFESHDLGRAILLLCLGYGRVFDAQLLKDPSNMMLGRGSITRKCYCST